MSTRKRKNKLRGGNAPRVAVLFCGRIKAYENALEAMRPFKDAYPMTFFASINKKNMTPYIQKFCDAYEIGPDQVKLIPTVMPDWVNKIDKHPACVPYNAYSILYHYEQAFKLLEAYKEKHKKEFDIIVQYRPDVHPAGPLDLSTVEKNTVYIPNWGGCVNPHDWDRRYGIHAAMSYGDFDTMKKYCSAVSNLEEMADKYNVAMGHEAIVTMNIVLTDLHVVRIGHQFGLNHQRQAPHPEYNSIE